MKEAGDLIKCLMRKNLTISFAESITCGLASHYMNTYKGTSETFLGSIVCYHESVKTGLLGVDSRLIKKYSAESTEVTAAMADALQQCIEADIYAAVTGLAVAGGSETPDKPVGSVFISIRRGNQLICDNQVFRGTPLRIKKSACRFLFSSVLALLHQNLTNIE